MTEHYNNPAVIGLAAMVAGVLIALLFIASIEAIRYFRS